MLDIFASGSSSIDRYIQTVLRLESQPRVQLQDRTAELNRRNGVLSDLDSKLSALNNLAKRLTDSITNRFAARKASSSNTDLFTASADSTALVGSHDIFIERLAKTDTRVSQQYSASATDLKSFFDTNGEQTFQIEVAHPTDADSDNRVSIDVAVNSSGATNDEVLDDIALAINNAMSAAVTDETINADEKVAAYVVHEEDGTSRLLLKSGQTGYTNRLDFTDSANSLLSSLQVNDNVQSSDTSGGYITAIGTSAKDSSLSAKLQMDGLNFYRDSNTIDDIIDGVTLNLKDVTDTTETLKISTDVETVKKEIQNFLDAYNDVLHYLKDKTGVDAATKTRGVLAGDTTYRGLMSTLRSTMSVQVTSVSTGNPSYLFEIGVAATSDGTLSLSDNDMFERALASGSSVVSDLFNSANGIATQVESLVSSYVKVGGIINNTKDNISFRIESLDLRITRFDERLGHRERLLRKQFAKMQEVAALLQSQQFSFQSLFSGF